MASKTTYGIGGYDPKKPNNNVVEEVEIPDFAVPVKSEVEALIDKLVERGVLTKKDKDEVRKASGHGSEKE